MKISEKQVMQLMEIAATLISRLTQSGTQDWYRAEIATLLHQINNQQPEELKDIEG